MFIFIVCLLERSALLIYRLNQLRQTSALLVALSGADSRALGLCWWHPSRLRLALSYVARLLVLLAPRHMPCHAAENVGMTAVTHTRLFWFPGFTKRDESEYDAFGTGHSSTSISAALGMAVGRDLRGKKTHSVAIIGDGAITGGMAYEAMNHAGFLDKNMIVILNDNQQVGSGC